MASCFHYVDLWRRRVIWLTLKEWLCLLVVLKLLSYHGNMARYFTSVSQNYFVGVEFTKFATRGHAFWFTRRRASFPTRRHVEYPTRRQYFEICRINLTKNKKSQKLENLEFAPWWRVCKYLRLLRKRSWSYWCKKKLISTHFDFISLFRF